MKRLLFTALATIFFVLVASPLAQSKPSKNYQLAKRTVNMVFSPEHRGIMLSILGCETGFTYNPFAQNPSGATGFFQILRSHDGTTYSYNGISITVDARHLTEAFYNTMVAYLMSHDGKDLSPWYSSRSCWG